jgi:hypothetical protein
LSAKSTSQSFAHRVATNIAVLLLVALLSALVSSGEHRHGLAGAGRSDCAACVAAHTPAVEPSGIPAIAPPALLQFVVPPGLPPDAGAAPFSHAAPLACGPPA